MFLLKIIGKAWYRVVAIAFACFYMIPVAYAEALQLDMTAHDIPKKVLIIKHEAKLFESDSSTEFEVAPFIQLYFLMTPEKNNRVPVLKTFSKEKVEPDGWLEKDTFVEWNTIQMVNFTPQTGRDRVKIYDSSECASEFGKLGELEKTTTAECLLLGEEPEKNPQSRLLIPIFQREAENYHGGFVRLQKKNGDEKDTVEEESETQATRLGYDLVLVVDSTLSMEKYFSPTLQVIQAFIQVIQGEMETEVATPFNIGLLFYRDRKQWYDCGMGYLTQWAQPLTSETGKVMDALDIATTTACDSEDVPEAVFDGVYRAIVDTPWKKSHFKTILLIGDAPPNFDKNPMNFTVSSLTELADEKSIRFLTFKIGDFIDIGFREFEAFALQREAAFKGRYRHIIRSDIEQFETDLMDALVTEWELFEKTLTLSKKGTLDSLSISAYELPIIIAQLQQDKRDFVKGWIPSKVKNQKVLGEYLFMRKIDLKLRVLIIESIVTAVDAGLTDGAIAFLDAVRQTLAVHLKMKAEDIFSGSEALGEILQKANLLPFKTDLLLFTPEEVNTWKPADYEKTNQSLKEKLRLLREFENNPNHLRLFEGVPYLYVPKRYFP
jgi:hypothetical protein